MVAFPRTNEFMGVVHPSIGYLHVWMGAILHEPDRSLGANGKSINPDWLSHGGSVDDNFL